MIFQTSTKGISLLYYHKILSEILKSFTLSQDVGIYWDLEYPKSQKQRVKFVFPLAFCIVDMKGGKQLCGQYGANTQVERPCISCYCKFDKLDNATITCTPVNGIEMKSKIQKEDEAELAKVSQHKIIDNAFFGVNTADWKYGIWGMCPSEFLHQYYEGIVHYTLDYFFTTLFSDMSRQRLNRGVQQVISFCKHQSDRTYPKATYSNGITYSAKMRGKEKFTALFYLSLYLYTSDSEQIYEGLNKRCDKKILVEWRTLFEKMLYYNDWVMQEKFSVQDVQEKQLKIIDLFKRFKKMVKRNEGCQLKIPKLHEFLHTSRDILWHGPARGFDTCPAESNHRPVKRISQNTQRIKRHFEIQTANRVHDDHVIYTAYNDTDLNSIQHMQHAKTIRPKNYIDNRSHFNAQGKFILKYNGMDRVFDNLNFYDLSNKKGNVIITNTKDFDNGLLRYVHDHIFEKFQDTVKEIQCFSTYRRDDHIFYGCPRDDKAKRLNSSWGLFCWAMDNGATSNIPGRCVVFLDLSNVKYKENVRDRFEMVMHVVIKSFQSVPRGNKMNAIHKNVAEICSLTSDPEYYCVPVDTIFDTAFVLPNFTKNQADQQSMIYVYPRDEWKNNF